MKTTASRLMDLLRRSINLDTVVFIESYVDLLKILANLLDSRTFSANDVLVEPGGAMHTLIDHRIGLLIHLVEGQTNLDLGSSKGDCLRVGVRGRHLYKNSSLGQDFIDGVSFGSNDVTMLALLNIDRDASALLLHVLPDCRDGCLDGLDALLLSSDGELVFVD